MEKKVNLLTGLNIVLLIAVAILFYFQFRTSGENTTDIAVQNQEEPKSVPTTPLDVNSSVAGDHLKIAYVKTDDMLMQLSIVKNLQQQLQYQEKKYEEDLGKRLKEIEAKMTELKKQVQKNLISGNIAKIKENELAKEQQSLVALRDRYTQQLGYQEMQVNQIIIDSIQNFLTRYNKDGKYDLIVNNVSGNDFLYVDRAYDITTEITTAMNKEFKK